MPLFCTPLFDEQMMAAKRLLDFIVESDKTRPGYDKERPNVIRFNAGGGRGKTHTFRVILKMLRDGILNRIDYRYAIVAFTGRAASHLNGDGVQATTIHQLLYKPDIDEKTGDIVGWTRNDVNEIFQKYDFLVIDEGSMIPSNIFIDLYDIGLPIIILGDAEQLDPIEDQDSQHKDFNIMEENHYSDFFVTHPDVTLVVNRRTVNADADLIDFIEGYREGGMWPSSTREMNNGLCVLPTDRWRSMKYWDEHHDKIDMVGCGYKETAMNVNGMIREIRGYDGIRPHVGERVLNLANDIRQQVPVMNGETCIIKSRIDKVSSAVYRMEKINGQTFNVEVEDSCWPTHMRSNARDKMTGALLFGQFTYGYAMTIFKLQGSTVPRMFYIDEDVGWFANRRKFRYTGISRAANELTVCFSSRSK